MNCSDRDQDILLLEHGALTGVKRWSTERHLRSCPRCQERREQHARVSHLMAAAVREDAPDLRPLFGMASTGVVAGGVVGAGVARLRPATTAVVPAARPGFIATAVAVATVIAAGAWIYKATALAPVMETEPAFPYAGSKSRRNGDSLQKRKYQRLVPTSARPGSNSLSTSAIRIPPCAQRAPSLAPPAVSSSDAIRVRSSCLPPQVL